MGIFDSYQLPKGRGFFTSLIEYIVMKLKALFFSSVILFLAGITMPMFSLEKFMVFGETFSIIKGITILLYEGNFLIALILITFSLVGPIYKYYICWQLIAVEFEFSDRYEILVNRLNKVGKWAMADVFVIAILASTIKLGVLADMSIHNGLVVFSLGVILALVLSSYLTKGYSMQRTIIG
jgi:paraquat-inducible protein A|tara:strand:+ start:656 stop:1198 length:543 start_codon:yes stop_codon:yes gene_type:complete